jgi:hypothetical protein
MNKEFSTENKVVHIKELIERSALFTGQEVEQLANLGVTENKSLVNEKTGKISASGKVFAEYIMTNEKPELLDVLLNSDDKNPFTAQQRTELIQTYLATVAGYMGRTMTMEEKSAVTKSLRARNLFRINRLKVGENNRFEAVTEIALPPQENGFWEGVKGIFRKKETKPNSERNYADDADKFYFDYNDKVDGEPSPSKKKLKKTARKMALKALLAAGLVTAVCVGTGIVYSINPSLFNALMTSFGSVSQASAGEISADALDQMYAQMTSIPATEQAPTQRPATAEPSDNANEQDESPEVEKIDNAYTYIKQALLTNLDAVEQRILEKETLTEQDYALLGGIDQAREKLTTQDEIIINIVVTDLTGENGRNYFNTGQEHIGNSDAFMQLVINKNGIFAISFGRDLRVPTMDLNEDGTYSEGEVVPIYELASPGINAQGGYDFAPNGMINTALDQGKHEAIAENITGQEALLNLRVSLGVLYKLADAAFPNKVDVHFEEEFNGWYDAGETVTISGRGLINHMRLRPVDEVNQGSHDRGLSFLRVIKSDPTNILRLAQAFDLTGLMDLIASQNPGPEDGREFMIGTTAEDLVVWQALKMAMEQDDFATNVMGLLIEDMDLIGRVARDKAGIEDFEIPMYTMQPPGEQPDSLSDYYQDRVEDIMEQKINIEPTNSTDPTEGVE